MDDSSPRSNSWKKLVLEAAVIVGSILLAFAIDAGWDLVQERRAEAELLATLRTEAIHNREQVVRDRDLVDENIAHLEAFLAMSPEEAAAIPPEEIWTRLGQPLWRSFINELSFTAVTAAVNSGNLATIRSDELRSLLSNAERRNDDADEVRARITVLSEDATLRLRWYPEVAKATSPEAFIGISPSTLTEIRRDRELVAYASSKVVYWGAYATNLSRFEALMDSVVAAIDR